MVSPREEWTVHCFNEMQVFMGSIMSAGTLDTKLFDVLMALRKLVRFFNPTVILSTNNRLHDFKLTFYSLYHFRVGSHWNFLLTKAIWKNCEESVPICRL